MKMQLADILDRLSIAMLKKHAGGLDVDRELEELEAAAAEYEAEVGEAKIGTWKSMLVLFNSLIWSLESDIRLGKEGILGHAEVGRRALVIRDHNAKRVKVKQAIATEVDEIVERKVNHASA